MFKLSVLVSGNGSTLDNLVQHCGDDGILFGFARITSVTADRECAARAVAEHYGLPFRVVSRQNFSDRFTWSESLLDANVDLHVMGGFLEKIAVPPRWAGRILNIYPSLLPAHYDAGLFGRDVHEVVKMSGDKVTGCTVHVIGEETVLAREPVAVMAWDTCEDIEAAVQKRERLVYPRAILNYLRLNIRRGGTNECLSEICPVP